MKSAMVSIRRSIWVGLRLLALLGVASSLIIAVGAHAGSAPPLPKIPDGYQSGRADALYGTYSSVVGSNAKSLQNRLTFLERRAMGLANLVSIDGVQQSEALFLLEHAVLQLNLSIANAPTDAMTKFERAALLFGTVHVYQQLRHHGERLFEDMVRFVDVQLPGPNGLQLRQDLPDSIDSLYLPNYRSDAPLSDKQRAKLYEEKKKEFLDKGGKLSEIRKLNKSVLAELGPYTRVEYVVKLNGDIMITEGSAGHILLAEGEATTAAGQIIFLKANDGSFTMVVASNASGSFKPDLYSIVKVKAALVQMTGCPEDSVVLTKGEPLSTQGVKIFSKALGLSKDLTAARVERLGRLDRQLRALKLQPVSHAPVCPQVFAKK